MSLIATEVRGLTPGGKSSSAVILTHQAPRESQQEPLIATEVRGLTPGGKSSSAVILTHQAPRESQQDAPESVTETQQVLYQSGGRAPQLVQQAPQFIRYAPVGYIQQAPQIIPRAPVQQAPQVRYAAPQVLQQPSYARTPYSVPQVRYAAPQVLQQPSYTPPVIQQVPQMIRQASVEQVPQMIRQASVESIQNAPNVIPPQVTYAKGTVTRQSSYRPTASASPPAFSPPVPSPPVATRQLLPMIQRASPVVRQSSVPYFGYSSPPVPMGIPMTPATMTPIPRTSLRVHQSFKMSRNPSTEYLRQAPQVITQGVTVSGIIELGDNAGTATTLRRQPDMVDTSHFQEETPQVITEGVTVSGIIELGDNTGAAATLIRQPDMLDTSHFQEETPQVITEGVTVSGIIELGDANGKTPTLTRTPDMLDTSKY